MKKLILLIPTILVTVFLALAFLLPATAAGVLRSVAPALQVTPFGVVAVAPDATGVAASPAKAGAAPDVGQGNSGSSSPKAPTVLSNSPNILDQRGHAVATAGEENCGRFGNGFHGGKHDFTCPNRPFPPPAS